MIVVTGASGLLGKTLLLKLLNGDENIKALYHHTPLDIIHPNLTVIQCDILDVCALEEVMTDADEVYHCAGMVSFSPNDEHQLFKINVEGTANVVNAALQANVKKLVHVSSVAALGRNIIGNPINEKSEWIADDAGSKYSHSKYLGEIEVWRAVAEGLNAVVVNPSIIIGAGNWNEGSTKIFKTVYDGFPYYSEGTSGFVDVDDVAEIMIQLMKSNISGEKFIVSAQNVTYQYLFNLIAKGFNKPEPSKKITPFLAGLSWRMAKLKSLFNQSSPLITKETAYAAIANVQYDNAKLLNALPAFKYRKIEESVTSICADLVKKI